MRSTQTILYSEIAVNKNFHAEKTCQIHLKTHAKIEMNWVFHVECELNLGAKTLFYLYLADKAECKLMLCVPLHKNYCIYVVLYSSRFRKISVPMSHNADRAD